MDPKQIAPICLASSVLCKAMGADAYNAPLPFTMGVIVAPLDPGTEGGIIVQWLVPPLGRESAAGGGRSRKAVDIFGSWTSLSSLALADSGHYKMPDVHFSKDEVLIGPIELDGGTWPFTVLDDLVDVHSIDITGLRWARTSHGHAYRSYRLFSHCFHQ